MPVFRLSIAGAVDDRECEGQGCDGCPYDVSGQLSLACQVEVSASPLSLLALLSGSLDRKDIEVFELRGLSTETEDGEYYDPIAVGRILEALERGESVKITNDADFPPGSAFNKQLEVQLCASLFRAAKAEDMPVEFTEA